MKTKRYELPALVLSAVLVAACAASSSAAAPAAKQAALAPSAKTTSADASAKPAADAPTSAFDYVGGLAIRAKEPKELARWYTEKFGLAMKFAFPGGVAGGFKSGDVKFNLAIVSAEGKHPGAAPGTGYFVLHVADYDRFLTDAEARGITPFEKTADAMGRFATFKDPEGNQVGVWGK